MQANILRAIINLAKDFNPNLLERKGTKNRANSMGDALETYIKDLFASVGPNDSEEQRVLKHSRAFSYLGGMNNPPDAMLRGGDAIEVKKLEGMDALALNSSYPKASLKASSPMISSHCKECEKWEEKELIYAVGCVQKNKLINLFLYYGRDYAAKPSVYERVKGTISSSLDTIPNLEFCPTNELGRVNKIDPLNITRLRVRGMWSIENPHRVFSYILPDLRADFILYALINNEIYKTFPTSDKSELETLKTLQIKEVKIKDPNNPAKLNNAKLIIFTKDAK